MVSRETFKHPLFYTVVSFLAVSLYVLDYVNTYGEVYTTVIALRSSSIFSLLAVNTTIAFFVGLWYFNTAIFFGALTPTERGAIAPAFPVYLAECIGIPLYLDQNMFSMKAGFMLFTVVLRVLHKLADERIITTSALPNGSRRTYMVIRVALFLLLSLSVDILVFCTCWIILGNNSRESEAMFTYCVLLLYGQFILSTFRYGLKLIYQQVADDRDNRSPMVFYAEKALEILHSFVFVGMFLLAYYHLGQFPFILLRNFFGHCYLISENCKNVYRYVVLSWRVDRLPNAAEEDLTPDVTCTICYEEMKFEEHPKVLPCGHTYHKNCLSRWFEGHATCPYCRADLLKAKIPPRQPVAPPPVPVAEGGQPDDPTVPRFSEDELINAYQRYLAFLARQVEMENANAVEEAENTNDPPRNDAVPPLPPTAVAPSEIASPSQVETELPSKPQDTTVGCSVLSQQAKVKILEKACDRYLEEVKEAQNRFLAEIETVMETF